MMQADEARELAWRLKYPGQNRCPVCSFQLAESADKGCVIGNCSYRPAAGSAEDGRVSRNRAELADAQGIIVAYVESLLARHALEATLAEHKSHIEFESELYAILVDPLAEGNIKEAEMRKALTEAALCSRELANRFNFTDLLKAAQQGLEIWAAKPGNHKWWKRIDGTPIPNDLLVNIVEAIRSLAERASKGGGREP